MMAPASDSLRIHLFGDGVGESILIESSVGWGMLDSFRWAGTVPALEYLRAQGCEELLFLGLTHPHADHFDGMNEVVKHFVARRGIREFWRYTGLDAGHLFPLLRARVLRKRDPYQATQQQLVSELAEAFDSLAVPLKSKKTTLRLLKLPTPLLTRGGLSIEAVAPPDQLVHESYERVAASVEREIIGESQVNWDLNRLSFAVRLCFHEHVVLLGGDVPAHAWTFAANYNLFPSAVPLGLLKSMHHGSARDNSPVILSRLAAPGSGLAVVTRYTPSQLPRRAGLAALDTRFKQVTVLGEELTPAQRKRKGMQSLPSFRPQRIEVHLQAGMPIEVVPAVAAG